MKEAVEHSVKLVLYCLMSWPYSCDPTECIIPSRSGMRSCRSRNSGANEKMAGFWSVDFSRKKTCHTYSKGTYSGQA